MKYIHLDKIFHFYRKNNQTIRLIENDNVCRKDNNTVHELQVKQQFLEKENLSLKEEAKHKRNMI